MSAKAFTVAVGVANMFDCEDDFPTIEAEPVKRGRWITDETAIDSGFTSCSCCHAEYYIGDLQALEGDNAFVIYCPNCGARMGEKNKYGG